MKYNFYFLLLAYVVFGGYQVNAATPSAFIPAYYEVPANELQNMVPGERSPIPSLGSWMQRNDANIVGDPRIVIRDGMFTGVEVDYNPKAHPISMRLYYAKFPNQIVIPDDVPQAEIIRDVWRQFVKGAELRDVMRPLGLNVGLKEGKSIASGLWYVVQDKEFTRYNRQTKKWITSGPNTTAINSRYQIGQKLAPMPAVVSKRPELIVQAEVREFTVSVAPREVSRLTPPNTPGVVAMPTFGVLGELLELRPYLRGRVIERMEVADHVAPPLARIGVKTGDVLVRVQGIDPVGLTEAQYDARMMATPLGEVFVLEFADRRGNRSKVNVVISTTRPQ